MLERFRFASSVVTLFVLAAACGDDGSPGPDAGPVDAAGSDAAHEDGGMPPDGSDDAGDRDAGPGGDGGSCACDVTSLCDEGCGCDVACTVEPGAPPLGDDTTLLDRAELAVYFASASSGGLDRVTVRDDAWDPEPGSTLAASVTPPSPAYASLYDPTARPALAARPQGLAADVDGDGASEVVLATSSGLVVEDWNGTALVPRTVATWGAAASADVAVGDFDADGTIDVATMVLAANTATLSVWTVGETGGATLIAATTRPGVDRGAIGIGDTNGDGTSELVLVYAELPTITATYRRVYTVAYAADGAGGLTGSTPFAAGSCEGSAAELVDEGGDVLVSDLDSDGTDEVAYGFACGSAGDVEVQLVDFDEAMPSRGSWTANGPGSDVREAVALMPTLVRARSLSAGDGPAEPPGLMLLGWTSADGSTVTSEVATIVYQPAVFARPLSGSVIEIPLSLRADTISPTVAAADVDLDGTYEIVLAAARVDVTTADPSFCGPLTFPCIELEDAGTVVWSLDFGFGEPGQVEVFEHLHATRVAGSVTGPLVVLGDFDGDGLRVRKTGDVLLRAGPPLVNAVLAAPPTWLGADGVVQAGSSATSFGTSESSSMSRSQQIGASASVTISAEGSYLDIVEVRGSVSVSTEYSVETSRETSVSVGTETTTGAASDLVVYRVTPYASHVYEVVSHPDPMLVGQHITIDVPGAMVETAQDLVGFRAEFDSYADEVVPPELFAHTLGDPRSYPLPGSCDEGSIDGRLSAVGDAFDVYVSDLVDVGNSPSGSTAQYVTFGEQTSRSTELSLGVEISAGVSVYGVGLDVTAGVSASWTHATTVGSDVTYTGAVAHIADPGYTASSRYRWGLCVFHYASADGQASYPVVGYVVAGL